jgi:hypothetical protein
MKAERTLSDQNQILNTSENLKTEDLDELEMHKLLDLDFNLSPFMVDNK